jgi:hypothetical protein
VRITVQFSEKKLKPASNIVTFLLITGLFGLYQQESSAQIVQISDTFGATYVLGGEYQVNNNVWGASTPQTLQVDQGSTYFKVLSSGHNNTGGTPASYPFILKGSHFGGTPTPKNNPLPMVVRNIASAPFTWSINSANVSGKWDAALDIWFGQGSTNNLEMMIWINYNGPQPAGSRISTETIGGYSWDVWYNGSGVVSYKITSVRDSISLDIKDFINDAVPRGFLNVGWSLLAIEAGFELWINGTNLTSKSFSATAVPGLSAIITSPSKGASFSAPATITITASASEPVGSIAKVEFFQGSTKLGESTTSPYSFSWTNVPLGSYSLTVKATDNTGVTTISGPVNVTVVPPPTGSSMEAETMILSNYLVENNSAASGGADIKLSASGVTGYAAFNFGGSTGAYDMQVWYFDENDGACTFRVYVNGVKIDEWIANQNLGSADPVAQTRTSRTIKGVFIPGGAQIKLEAVQDAQEWGRYDNIEIRPATPTPVEPDPAKDRPTMFQLHQNYPNPFNPSTAITYQLPASSSVQLKIYDTLGRVVRTLVKGVQSAGDYVIQWDGKNTRGESVSSGVYLYQLAVGSVVTTKKMLLSK